MDDLSRLLVQQPQPGARFGQGTLREWNPDTFEHVIEWRGLRITGATILAGVDALTWQPGDQVLLLGADQSGRRGWTDWMVLGRAITPGPGAADQAIAPMRTSLAQQIAVAVFAQRVHTGVAAPQTQTSSTSYGDGSHPGPSVSGVDVTESGRALVLVSCLIDAGPITNGQVGAFMSYEVSGATSRAPSPLTAVGVSTAVLGAGISHRSGGRFAAADLVTGLNPGTHTFTAKYASQAENETVRFSNRSLTVIAF